MCVCARLCEVRILPIAVAVPSFHAPSLPCESSSPGSLSGLFDECAAGRRAGQNPIIIQAHRRSTLTAARCRSPPYYSLLTNNQANRKNKSCPSWINEVLSTRRAARGATRPSVAGITAVPSPSLLWFSLAGPTSAQAAEFSHLPDNITVLEGESVILRWVSDPHPHLHLHLHLCDKTKHDFLFWIH